MKNTTLLAIIIGILVAGGAWFFIHSKSSGINGDVVNESGDVQKITLGIKNRNYYPNTINVKAGIPVELTLDSSVVGCLRSFNIAELGVKQYSASPSQKIKFTPTQKGSFRFACSMGMGYGTIIVE